MKVDKRGDLRFRPIRGVKRVMPIKADWSRRWYMSILIGQRQACDHNPFFANLLCARLPSLNGMGLPSSRTFHWLGPAIPSSTFNQLTSAKIILRFYIIFSITLFIFNIYRVRYKFNFLSILKSLLQFSFEIALNMLSSWLLMFRVYTTPLFSN